MIVLVHNYKRLSKTQKQYASEAVAFVEPAVAAYIKRNRSYKKQLDQIDCHSIAYAAIVDAARTYDPERSRPTTYFSAAVRNALWHAVQNQKRHERLRDGTPIEIAVDRSGIEHQRNDAMRCLECLPEDQKDLIQRHLFDNESLLSLGERLGKDWRTIRSRIQKSLRQLRECLEN